MRQISLLLFFVASALYAQPDLGSGVSLPAGGIKAITPSPAAPTASTTPSLFDTPPARSFHIDEEPLNANFGKTKTFVNPNDAVLERLNQKPKESADGAIRRDQFMGEIKTKTHSVRVVYRDHEAPDGDVCEVLVNDVVVRPRIYLDSAPQSFEILLHEGMNRIDFLALNQGESGPNTAEFEVYDEEGHLLGGDKWNLATGFKATIIVTKQ